MLLTAIFNVVSVLMNCKHFHLTYFIRKVITTAHAVDKRYLIIWGCFTEVKARKRPQ